MKPFKIFLLFFFFSFSVFAQDSIQVYPTHWWVGMRQNKLQLLLHGNNIADHSFSLLYPGVRLLKTTKVENKNYVFLDLSIAPAAKPGHFTIRMENGSKINKLTYELKQRRTGNGTTYAQGVTQKDFIYLVMPDRFANGDTANDAFSDLRDTAHSRTNPFLRHGGDIKGVQDHMEYLKSLGVTALWLTPVMENNMPLMQEGPHTMSGYHGYWITDHYKVDKRMGGNDAYKHMVENAHQMGLKIIQDAVYNHVGAYHWFVLDPPMKDWINQWPSYQGTHHREEVFTDPYVAAIDKEIMVKGWFVPHLPDVNLANPYAATYIIQNTIWATEEFGVDGWRVDTYKYNDEAFLNKINTALVTEFPALSVFGEVTSNAVTTSAYFTKNNIKAPFNHNLQGVTDFPLCYAMLAGMNEPFGWTNGVNRIYMALAQDLLYQDPTKNCIFLDNHDMDRVLSVVGEDTAKFKMGLTWLLTLRGIPQMYYGTEILMKNFKNPTDAEVRRDFPGGWAHDSTDKFNAANRTTAEQSAWQFIAALANFRKSSKALTAGKLMQYIPENGVYTYFRYHPQQTVMVLSNSGATDMPIRMDRFRQRTAGFTKRKNILTGEVQPLADFTMPAKQSLVFELLK